MSTIKFMPEVMDIERHVKWKGVRGQYSPRPIDGVCIINYIDKGSMEELYVPFRAKDKGGMHLGKRPFIWRWENPYDPIHDATLTPIIKKDVITSRGNGYEVSGKVVEGEWINVSQD